MNIDTIWAAIEPYVMAIVGALGGGTAIYALVRSFVGKWITKFGAKYDTEIMANKVAERLAGKTIDIDVTAVTEKKLDKLSKLWNKKIDEIKQASDSYKHILALIAAAVSKFKAVSDDERAALIQAIQTIEKDYTPIEPDVVTTVKLTPIELEGKTEEKGEQDESLINFGGIASR